MTEALYQLLGLYVVATSLLLAAFAFATIYILRRDKHFALALVFGEIAMYAAISTFGQAPLSGLALSMEAFEAVIDVQRAEPSHWAAFLVIVFAGLLSAGMMALRTWDKQIPRNPRS